MSAEKQKTILLVEDEVFTAMAAKKNLEQYGNKVLTANTGEEAVATFEKTPGIDLVLMDINLGAGIDGAEAAEIILRERDLPVIFLSSHTEPEIVAKTERITSYGFVVKHSGNTVLDASIKMAFKLFEAKIKDKEKESQLEAALEAVRKSEGKYRGLTENINLGIYRNTVGPEGKFIEANPAIIGMFGYKNKEEFLAINVSDLYQNPEDRNKFNDRMLKEGFVRGEELWLKKKVGSLFIGSGLRWVLKTSRVI